MRTSRDRKKIKVRIDGKLKELELNPQNAPNNSALLRLIEYKYLFPQRSIKHVEKNGEIIHPSRIDEIEDLSKLNIVTEPSTDMVRKQIELALLALDAMITSIPKIVADWKIHPDLAKLHLNNILDSLDWSVKVVENGAKILPIYEGLDEAIAKLEDAVFQLDDLLYEGKEMEALRVMEEDFLKAIREWQNFLKGMVRFIKSAPGETH